MDVMVVDAQGGGLGKALIERIKQEDLAVRIIAVGTNYGATSAMLKAGADSGATGDNAIMYNADKAHVIMGGLGVISANSMMGEISQQAANGISCSEAVKILVPHNKCNLLVAGVRDMPMAQKVEEAVQLLKKLLIANEKP